MTATGDRFPDTSLDAMREPVSPTASMHPRPPYMTPEQALAEACEWVPGRYTERALARLAALGYEVRDTADAGSEHVHHGRWCDPCVAHGRAIPAPPIDPERLAQMFHEAYERLAPSHGYETRKASAVPWASVPEPNRSLMVAVAGEVLAALGPTPEGRWVTAEDAKRAARTIHSYLHGDDYLICDPDDGSTDGAAKFEADLAAAILAAIP